MVSFIYTHRKTEFASTVTDSAGEKFLFVIAALGKLALINLCRIRRCVFFFFSFLGFFLQTCVWILVFHVRVGSFSRWIITPCVRIWFLLHIWTCFKPRIWSFSDLLQASSLADTHTHTHTHSIRSHTLQLASVWTLWVVGVCRCKCAFSYLSGSLTFSFFFFVKRVPPQLETSKH